MVLASLVALAVPTAGAVGGDEGGRPHAADDPVSRKRKIDASVKALDAQVDRTAARVRAASNALERAAAELPRARRSLTQASAGVRAAGAAAEATAVRAAHTRAEILHNARLQDTMATDVMARRAAVAALARSAFTGGDFSRLGMVLGARSPEELTSSMVYLQSVTRAQRDALEGLAVAEVGLEANSAELAALQQRDGVDRRAAGAAVSRAVGAVEAATAAQRAVSALVAERRDALGEARKLRAFVTRELAEQEAESRRLAKVIAARIAAARRAAAQKAAAQKIAPNLGGLLGLPVLGRISSGYGMRYHPILRRTKMHTGIDFAAPTGTSIRSAADGEVLQVVYNGAYGRRVVVDHGNVGGSYLVTTYNHLSRFAVRPGQRLTRGQILGYVGSTGFSTGPHLHFEVLSNGRFVDPMTKLRRAG